MSGLTDSKSLTLKDDEFLNLLEDEVKFKWWIKLEKILAEEEAKLGIIPKENSDAIQKEVSFDNFSIEKYQDHLREIGHGFYSFVETVLDGTSDEAKKYFHYGITTQNIQQSSQILIIRDINQVFEARLDKIVLNLADLAEKHKKDIIPARTHSKHAMPTTFGYIVASWIEELLSARKMFKLGSELFEEIMFGGAIGAFNSLGEKGYTLQENIGKRLDIRPMPIPSRNIQSPRISYLMGMITVTNVLHKIAESVYNNSTEELSEFKEYSDPSQVGSSTMPHKINPKLSKGIIGNSAKLYDLIYSSLFANTKPYESNSSSYMILDANVNDAILYFYEVIIRSVSLSENIIFDKDKAMKDILNNGGLDNSEFVMMKLSESIGKYNAHSIIHDLAIKYQNSKNFNYLDLLMENELIAKTHAREEVENWLKPENYIGLSKELTEITVKKVRTEIK